VSARLGAVSAIGVDLTEVEDIASAIRTFGEKYTYRVFSDAERACGQLLSGGLAHLAVHFAAKEASFKALAMDDPRPPWTSVELTGCGTGSGSIRLSGRAAQLADERGTPVLKASVSHLGAFAFVVVVGLGPRRGAEHGELRA